MSPQPAAEALPPLLRGPRKGWLTLLVLLGTGQAALGGLSAWALIRLGAAPAGVSALALVAVAVLLLSALAVGVLRVHERVVAEQLGQHYVHELRLALIGDALTPGHSTSLGVTVARTTNDLAGVRNWVSQGLAPLAVAGPLILGSLAVLAVIDVRLALAVALPLLVLGAVLLGWARTALRKTRALRRERGRLAARIADTVTASEQILAAGGSRRELRHVREASHRVVASAVDRAGTVGAIRAAGVVAATCVTLLVAASGTLLDLPGATTVAAMAVAGLAATPVLELGRIVEHRQNHRAARMVLGPALAAARARRDRARERREASAAQDAPPGGALVHLELPGLTVPGRPLRAEAGERIRLTAPDPAAGTAFVRRLLELETADGPAPDCVWVAGENLRAVPSTRVRTLVGRAGSGTVFERGSVGRALHYRRPDLDGAEDAEVLARVGLDPSRLPSGLGTALRRGGEPLHRADRARLALARAIYADPPLLLVDGLEGDLDDAGRGMLERVLARYPGVVLLIGSDALCTRLGAREHRLLAPPARLGARDGGMRAPRGGGTGRDDATVRGGAAPEAEDG